MSLSCDDEEVCGLMDTSEEELFFVDAIRSHEDHVLLKDDRILINMAASMRKKADSIVDYFKSKESSLKPHMRKIVTDWMLEVCEAQRCHVAIFPLAVNYMDRFLSVVPIEKNQFQLLASVCLFVASKFKESMAPLCADKLVVYSDFAFNASDIIEWELLVLQVLRWDLSVVTSQCVLDQLLMRIQVAPEFDARLIRRHAETFVALATTELDFMLTSPCTLAVAALMAAMQGMTRTDSSGRHQRVLRVRDDLRRVAGGEEVEQCVDLIEAKVLERLPHIMANKDKNDNHVVKRDFVYTAGKLTPPPAAATPTDLMDVSL